MKFSLTQAGNIVKLVSAILVLLGAQPFSESETNAIIIVIGLIGEAVGFLMSWIGRKRLGDLTWFGTRKPHPTNYI